MSEFCRIQGHQHPLMRICDMKTILTMTLGMTVLAAAAFAQEAGFRDFNFEAPHHGRKVTGAVWYPATGAGEPLVFGDNPIFYGVDVAVDARVAAGPFPVVVLSHGMGGNIRSLAWLAASLAEKGAIVVSVNHLNSTWGDFDLAQGMRHWTRAQDLRVALDTLWADPVFAGHIDEGRVMAAGFSYGGWTALALGGLQGDFAGYAAHCAKFGAASVDCEDMVDAGVDLSDIAHDAWNASYRDARVNHVVAIDPGLIWGLDAQDLAGLISDVRLIGLGDPATRLLAADFDKSGFAALLPDAQIEVITPAMHFTAMPLCKPAGAEILREEGDDPVCSDPIGTDRAAVHATIIARIEADLGL